ncbi:MAG: cytochrome c [Rhodospirillales bacterium]|nr:cytochrome c [Rhodospirillales bacterium]
MQGATPPSRLTAASLGLAAAFAMIAPGPAAAAGDPAAGREKAVACRPCHGLDGLSRQPDAPSIAGQVELYLGQQLADYRSGKRQHPVMGVIAGGLSDQDIADLAAWYAAIKVTAEPPE